MAVPDYRLYDLISCDPASYPSLTNLGTSSGINMSFTGSIVYIRQPFAYTDPSTGVVTNYPVDNARTYTLTDLGVNTALVQNWLPSLGFTNFDVCAPAYADKVYTVRNCNDPSDVREVRTAAAYSIGRVLNFTGENTCYVIESIQTVYDEEPTVVNDYDSCDTCLASLASAVCEYDERQLSYAVGVQFPKAEPVNRGFAECCYSNIVFGDLSDTDPYKNDFTSVYYKRQTPSDTVTYDIIGASTGTTTLVDGTHGVLYAYGGAEQPDLSYFKVEWRKILSTIGEDVFTIRMNLTIGGVSVTKDSLVTYDLKQFSQTLADNTVRIDGKMDGKLEKIDTDFKNTGYENSVRVQGYFGDAQANWEEDSVVFSSKNGQKYYDSQITMSNSEDYLFKAYNIPECVIRPLYKEILFSNQLFISDYNLNNHSYLFELQPVKLKEDNGREYQVFNRGVNINLTFEDRTKDNRKTNC